MELTDTLNDFAQKHVEPLAINDKASLSSDEDRYKFCGGKMVKIYLIYSKLMIILL